MSEVLVLYTGGTIGMKWTPKGYCPVPNYFENLLTRLPQFNDQESGQPGLTTPVSIYGKRVHYRILELDPLLDSSNMSMKDWARIALAVQENYKIYDAFIILHGTDTMAYTASALSFMLENLGKTVILTGSQVPLSELRNDAHDNLLVSLILAGHFVIPEVSLYFNHVLYRGNRCVKLNALDFNAFDSPNLPPLVTVGVNIGTVAEPRLTHGFF